MFKDAQHIDIDCHNNLSNYFCQRLQEVSKGQSIAVDPDTFWYISQMLARFARSENFLAYENGKYDIHSLALLYKEAAETTSVREKEIYLRQLGDLSLFLGALFAENYARRGIKRDYFVGMGGAAYDYLADNAFIYQSVFAQLATCFAGLVDMVAEACSKQNPFDATDILHLYQRWKNTGDAVAKRQLQALGISLQNHRLLQ